jgi:hypothetical protein
VIENSFGFFTDHILQLANSTFSTLYKKVFKLVSELPPQEQKQILEELVFIDKASRLRHVKSEADVQAFIVGFLVGKEMSK